MSDKETKKAEQQGQTGQIHQVSLDTPQQDSDWSEKKKLEWIKNSSVQLLKVFNQI
jgi:hypothetical protein